MDISLITDIASYVVMGFGGLAGTLVGIETYKSHKAEKLRESNRMKDED